MKLDKLVKYSLIAAALSYSSSSLNSTTGGAVFAFGLGSIKKPAATAEQSTAATTPEIDEATKKVDTAKANLDLAHKRLDAAKSLVKAADAEYRAAKSSKDALVLNTQAKQLADASGLPKNGENVPATPASATDTAPATATPVYNSSNENTIDFSGQSAPAPSGR